MKHSIRINGQVKEIDCQLDTGLIDKHRRKIFEGDMVIVKGYTSSPALVFFEDGFFYIWFTKANRLPLALPSNKDIEIVDD